MFVTNLYAEAAAAQAKVNPLASFMPLIIIFLIFYFIVIKPQQKKSKLHKEMLNNLKKGDKVITSGGIHGSVSNLKGEAVELNISENVKILISKDAISQIFIEKK